MLHKKNSPVVGVVVVIAVIIIIIIITPSSLIQPLFWGEMVI
jgi:hypothetical protein